MIQDTCDKASCGAASIFVRDVSSPIKINYHDRVREFETEYIASFAILEYLSSLHSI